MPRVKIRSVNSVLFGTSTEKGTPYIRILCIDENGEKCTYTGWKTAKNLEYVKTMLAHFKLSVPLSEIVEEDDPSARARFFKPPSDDVIIEEQTSNGKIYRNITGSSVDTRGDNMDKAEIREAWSNLDFTVSDVTKSDNKGVKDPF